MKTLEINRDKWNRGRLGNGDTELLNEEGNMCCLGFHCLQFTKATREDIRGKQLPSDISVGIGKTILLGRRGLGSWFADAAANINDDENISEQERELLLKKLFKIKSYEINFTGKLLEVER